MRPVLVLSTCLGAFQCGPTTESTPEDVIRPVEQDPQAAAQQRDAARAHRQAGRTREALAAFEQAFQQDPTHAEGALELAGLLLANILEADANRALQVLDTTFGKDTADLAARRLMARGAYRAHRTERAGTLALGLAEDPAAPVLLRGEARFLLGQLAEDAGDFAMAAEEYRRALDERPDRALYACRLGLALEETGDEEGAEALLRQAIRLDPGHVEAHFRLAGLLRRLGRDDEADQQGRIHRALNRAIDSTARTAASLEEKCTALREAETLLPEYVAGRLLLCELRMAAEDPKEAAQVARRLMDDHPDVTRAYALWIEAMRRDVGDEATRNGLRELLREVTDMPAAVRQEALNLALKGFRQ